MRSQPARRSQAQPGVPRAACCQERCGAATVCPTPAACIFQLQSTCVRMLELKPAMLTQVQQQHRSLGGRASAAADAALPLPLPQPSQP